MLISDKLILLNSSDVELRFLVLCDTCLNTDSSDVKQEVLINRQCPWSS